jgi:opacity protein-like surface antigen
MTIHQYIVSAFSILCLSGIASAEGYYVRADFAYSWSWEQESAQDVATPPPSEALFELSPKAVPLGQFGYGYFAAPYARADITAAITGGREYDVTCANNLSTCQPGTKGSGKVDSSLFLLNVYYELASLWSLEKSRWQPYLGFGIGGAYQNAHGLYLKLPEACDCYSYVSANTHWQFVWRGVAGLAVEVYKGLLVDVSYAYTDAGEALFGDTITASSMAGSLHVTDPIGVDMKTQEAYIGLRYQF